MKTYEFELEAIQGPVKAVAEISDANAPGSLVDLTMPDFDVEQEEMMAFMTGRVSEGLLLWRVIHNEIPLSEGWDSADAVFHIATGYKYSQQSDTIRALSALLLPADRRVTVIGMMCSPVYRLAKRPTESLLVTLIDSLVSQDAITNVFSRRDCTFPFGVFLESYKKLDDAHRRRVIKSTRMGSFDISDWLGVAEISGDSVKRLLAQNLARSPHEFNYAYVPVDAGRALKASLDIAETIENERLRAGTLAEILIQAGWHVKPGFAKRLGDLLLRLDRDLLYEYRDTILGHNNIFPPETAGKFMTLLRHR